MKFILWCLSFNRNHYKCCVTGLNPETTYSFSIIAKDSAANKSESSTAVQGTNFAWNRSDLWYRDFENIPSTGSTPPASSHTDRTWSSKGIVWTATNTRTDTQIYIDGPNNKSICIKKGYIKSSVISGGVGTLKVKTYLPFADSAGNYTLKINGVVKGLIPYSKTAKHKPLKTSMWKEM